jgi:hydrogenase expression/formation protein HypD
LELDNFSLLVAHVRVLPAMEALLAAPGNRVQGFLAAGHVCTIEGLQEYTAFVNEHQIPVVAAGFEPVDLLDAILACVQQLEAGSAKVENRYSRSIQADGNLSAQQLVSQVYECCDGPWRGLGEIGRGRLRLRGSYANFDAQRRFASLTTLPIAEPPECRSADVLAGRLKPSDCPEFGDSCTPTTPLGAPMVSTEGACAAYYRYHK